MEGRKKGGHCSVATGAFRRDVWRTGMNMKKLQAETVMLSVGINAKGDQGNTKIYKRKSTSDTLHSKAVSRPGMDEFIFKA